MKKLKLVYVLHDIQVGGVEVALVSAIPALSEQFDLKVIALGKIDRKMIAHLTQHQQACFLSADYPLITYPILLFRIVWLIMAQSPDIMVCSLWRASLAGSLVKWLRSSVTFISFVHSTTFFHPLDGLFTKLAIRNADHVFADSSATARFVQNQPHFSSNTTVISFFVKESPLEKTSPEFDGTHVKFMFLGRLSKVKNLSKTIDAIQCLYESGFTVTLDIYGPDAGELEIIDRYIIQQGLDAIVKLHGEVNAEQKAAAFREHHFLIQLSSNEGMAMSVAEAMQNGLVCFTTPVGEIRNYATDMETAVFANIDDPNEWELSLLKLKRLIQDPLAYQRLSNQSFQHFQSVETYAHSLTKSILSHARNHENSTYHHVG